MNAGKVFIVGLGTSALVAGMAMYYFQVYGFYEEVNAEVAEVQLTSLVTGQPEEILFENFKAIDSDSSPVRFRACFNTGMSLATLTETYEIYDAAEPLVAPNWFDCFDARRIGEDLETGDAVAFLGQENIQYGIDRIVAVYPDGSAFAWHQINACGEVVFDGNRPPEGCPTPPESLN
ncbi:DUF6446 family protein [Yoonia sp. 208BN28-4]|uniref:DUF6446 family protein n=1 Tax=Yoonia sp. 208BN28-4 TaxID=3126505 RepID=UPI00309519F0